MTPALRIFYVSLSEFLLILHQMVPNPSVLLSADFNYPSIAGLDEGVINYWPTYDYDINQSFLDAVNEYD